MIDIKSPAFDANAPIPRKYTGEGEDISPPLAWSGLPDNTQEIAIICDDPDAPTPEPWVHWVLYGLPASVDALEEGADGTGKAGINSFDRKGYGGPMPPPGHGTHHYHFKIYALDTELDLPAGARKADVEKAIADHVLDQGELIGTYER